MLLLYTVGIAVSLVAAELCYQRCLLLLDYLRGTIVNRTYGKDKKRYIFLF